MKFGRVGKSVTGVSAAAMIAMSVLIMPWESVRYKAYVDMAGVLTVCYGHTGADIAPDKIYTHEECVALLVADTKKHEAYIDRATTRPIPDLTKAAFISFVFNTGRFKGTTLEKKVNAGDLRGACDQLSRWVYVKGEVVNGLMNRRVLGDATRYSERTICLMGLDAGYAPPWLETVLSGA